LASNADKKRRNENTIKNPGAAIVIYNYKYRLGTPGLSESEAHEIDQVILNTVSLKSVSTSKSKSQPAGQFEIRLAPTKNWVNSITPGSWVVILMGQDKIFANDTKYYKPTARQSKVKMLGRIDSVRAVTAVDQATGSITTEYVVTGEDWGGVLNTVLYVDPLLRGKADEKDQIGAASRVLYNKEIIGYGSDKVPLPSSSDNINTLFGFWGKNNTTLDAQKKSLSVQGRIGESKNRFRLPKELYKYFNFTDGGGKNPSGNIADILRVVSGKLKAKDNGGEYKNSYEKVNDGASPIMFDTLLGQHSFWQLVMNNSNHWINDTYAEMRWENGQANLAVYNRVKPFAFKDINKLKEAAQAEVHSNSQQSVEVPGLKDIVSPFKNIRTHDIARSDVMMVNVGSNWRDRYNFIEVNVSSGMLAGAPGNETYSAETKAKNQTYDEIAIGRDGFKPMIINAKYIPTNIADGKLDPFRILEYKVMNREWFFNLHRTLNGSLTLIGQDDYIAVGDNLIIDADAIFPGQNTNEDHIKNKGRAYFLAHIESVSHNSSVNEVGARTFITEIQFVRGVITDKNGNQLDEDVYLDQDTTKVTPVQELNQNRVFGTSAPLDPDIQKLKGN